MLQGRSLQRQSLRRGGAWAALFALVLQIGLSFGHIHPLQIAGAASASLETQSVSTLSPALPHPVKESPDGLADDACAICASIHLAAALIVPEPISIAPRGIQVLVVQTGTADFGLPAVSHHPFQTRAPPAA